MAGMITGFPEPPAQVTQALHHLQIVSASGLDGIDELGADLERLPRPWAPGSCDPWLRRQVWDWCDAVAAWINRDCLWRPAGTIPACWPQHPHLAHDLPLLACQRWLAEDAAHPGPMDDWHRIILPAFLDRMWQRLEQSSCLTGTHQDWPGRTRYQAYRSAESVATRQRLFHADTNTPAQPSPPNPTPAH
jgi:hypothetical protein